MNKNKQNRPKTLKQDLQLGHIVLIAEDVKISDENDDCSPEEDEVLIPADVHVTFICYSKDKTRASVLWNRTEVYTAGVKMFYVLE